MDYQSHYDRLITAGRLRDLGNCYKERHHIIPRCLGGNNDKSNIVELTPEEHYVAHQLLIKLNPNHSGIASAAIMMSVNSNSLNRSNNKLYGWLRRKFSASRKGASVPEETRNKLRLHNLGKTLTVEHKSAITSGLLKYYEFSEKKPSKLRGCKLSEETRIKISIARKGSKASEETKKKLSESHKGIKRTPEAIAKQVEKQRGRKHTDEAKAKMSKALKGKKFTPEHYENVKKANQQRVFSEEALRRIGEASKGRCKDRKHTAESIQKMKEAKLQYWARKREENQRG